MLRRNGERVVEWLSIRVIVEPAPRPGAMNMALDEVFLESALERNVCTLRLYRWSEPTVSLGYFQKPSEAVRDPALAGLPVVRRLSGGGAILHHFEWTYSVALAPAHPLSRRPLELYSIVHAAIVEWLNSQGVAARMRGEVDPAVDPAAATTISGLSRPPMARVSEPFLCFGRGDPRDIVLAGHKVVGSAQRRRRGGVLQHGSLLLRTSPHAPEFPGLVDLSGRDDLEDVLPGEFLARAGPRLGVPSSGRADAEEQSRAAVLAAERYSSSAADADD